MASTNAPRRIDHKGLHHADTQDTRLDKQAGPPARPRVVAVVDMGAYETDTTCGCPGDADGDNSVDLDDLQMVLFYFEEEVEPCTDGDVDGDGDVDINDLNIVLFFFGESCEGENAQMLLEALEDDLPRFLEELGFTSLEEYTNYVRELSSTERLLHCLELIISYAQWGEE